MQSNKNGIDFGKMDEKEVLQYKIAVMEKFADCDVLMRMICNKLGLVPNKTTHDELIGEFTKLVLEAMEYRKEFQQKFVSATTEPLKKERKKRMKKEVVGDLLENAKEETMEDLEDFVPKNQVY